MPSRRLKAHVQSTAESLWRHAREGVQDGTVDDRALYWVRLACCNWLNTTAQPELAEVFDKHSRGFYTPIVGDRPICLVTGFDPFRLDQRTDQSNPSGFVALALNETTLADYTIQSSIFPVRYDDFDKGIVEHVLTGYLQHPKVKLVITTSMGRQGFDLEKYVGGRRSSNQPDNNDKIAKGKIILDSPEFLQYSLPRIALPVNDNQFDWYVRENSTVTTVEKGTFQATSISELTGQQAVEGSGGGYLSNEIAFRSQYLRQQLDTVKPVGHIHLPRVEGFKREQARAITSYVEGLLVALLAQVTESTNDVERK